VGLKGQIAKIEKLVGTVDDVGTPQCPHALQFLGQVLACPGDRCGGGYACGRAREILLERLARMERRMRDASEW
jgi:hypothetical protein